MKTQWLYLGIGVLIACIILSEYMPYYMLWEIISDINLSIYFIAAYVLFSILIINKPNRFSFYLLGLIINAVFFYIFYLTDRSGHSPAFLGFGLAALIIYTIIVFIAFGISHLVKKAKRN